jgi:hypothetical protein
MASIKITASLSDPKPNLCRNCVHFMPNKVYSKNEISRYTNGKCGYYHSIDLVTGEIEYKYVFLAREYDCKGEHYTKKEIVPKTWWKFWEDDGL